MIVVVTFAIVLVNSHNTVQPQEKAEFTEINHSIDKAIGFLYENQLNNGAFKIFACFHENLEQCTSNASSSVFVTASITYSLLNLKGNEIVDEITSRTLEFLINSQRSGGLWGVYRYGNDTQVTPDSDDTSIVSAVLMLFNKSFDENLGTYSKYRDDGNLIYLWMNDDTRGRNLIDCEVNSNVLFYFGIRKKQDKNICDFVNDKIRTSYYTCCVYCENRNNEKNPLPLFYMVARAYKHGNPCLGTSKEHIIEEILALQKTDGSFGNEQDTAFALNALLNFDYFGIEINHGIKNLLEKQRPDGSWGLYILYLGPAPYYGSEELTTALALEALEKYGKLKTA